MGTVAFNAIDLGLILGLRDADGMSLSRVSKIPFIVQAQLHFSNGATLEEEFLHSPISPPGSV